MSDKKAEKSRLEQRKQEDKARLEAIKKQEKERRDLEKKAAKESEERLKYRKKHGQSPPYPRTFASLTVPSGHSSQMPAPAIAEPKPTANITATRSSNEPEAEKPQPAGRVGHKVWSPPKMGEPQPSVERKQSEPFIYPEFHPAPAQRWESTFQELSEATKSSYNTPQTFVRHPTQPRMGADMNASAQEDEEEEEEFADVGHMLGSDPVENAEYLAKCVAHLRALMTDMYDDGTNSGYEAVFQALAPVGSNQPAEATRADANKLKNRYANIVAYDSTRVVLPVINDDPATDYINANYIPGHNNPRAYIATQGPIPNSFSSFWRMIAVEKIEVIVMVTNEYEGGKLKCHRYWPDPTSIPSLTKQQYGGVYVEYRSVEQFEDYAVRVFVVTYQGESRFVRHLYFQSWPDHGVPLTTNELQQFRAEVRGAVTDPNVPILVHCSAGVGRTGTFIAVDHLLNQCTALDGIPNIDEVVRQMRLARNYMIQTEMQFVFVYRTLLDALTTLLEVENAKVQKREEAQERRKQLLEQTKMATMARKELHRREIASINAAGADYMSQTSHNTEGFSIKARMRALKNFQKAQTVDTKRSFEEWNARNSSQAESYDVQTALTPTQSKLEALRQKGLLG